MVNWEKSYIYGKRQEAKILPLILSHFGREISPSVGRFAKYDYTDKDFNYEVKSRTNKMKAFKEYYCEQFSRAGIEADEKPHYYIPIDHLSVIEEY